MIRNWLWVFMFVTFASIGCHGFGPLEKIREIPRELETSCRAQCEMTPEYKWARRFNGWLEGGVSYVPQSVDSSEQYEAVYWLTFEWAKGTKRSRWFDHRYPMYISKTEYQRALQMDDEAFEVFLDDPSAQFIFSSALNTAPSVLNGWLKDFVPLRGETTNSCFCRVPVGWPDGS